MKTTELTVKLRDGLGLTVTGAQPLLPPRTSAGGQESHAFSWLLPAVRRSVQVEGGIRTG